ncbi:MULTISPECIES: hypothetical protein [Maribacter]|uniref:Lipocalin-like domain-containing protein n=2 Tax=Maribacter TaxID=252356 RepID=A0A5B2TT90_9FLAO|nr:MULTISPECIES: hypothetical protein [Maribacter]KAA2216690.1 hypothetical protein F0361_11880 [Maribacter flavus]MDC6406193.1 hypothetical protein [Maribacter sp. PR66]MEE1973313.1 hypothetical protein [Maribacter flavus]TLF44370.1 hypothetical protein FEK29_11160 [Maribacter aurantiacus]
MKKLIGSVFLMFILVTLTSIASTKLQTPNSLEGTWELINRYNYDEQGVSDTLQNVNGYRQVKIYSKGKVMWTRYSPDDPVEWFGYGSYTNTEDELEERLEFASAEMMKVQDTVKVFKFELVLDENNYSQITLDDNGNRIYAENYKRID